MRARGRAVKRVDCSICGARCRSMTGLCAPCRGDGPDTLALHGGHWVNVGGVQRYVPWTAAECAERAEAAREHLRKERLAALNSERYAEPTWWKAPDVITASEQTGAERVAAMVADFDRLDARIPTEAEVA